MEERSLIERLARHLAAETPDQWSERVDAVASILAIIKDADAKMRAVGDMDVWERMIDAALRERWTVPQASAEPGTPGGADEEGDIRLSPEAIGHDRADWVHIGKSQEDH